MANLTSCFFQLSLLVLPSFRLCQKKDVFFFLLSWVAEVFELHMEELRAKQEEISKRDEEIKLLEAIIQTLGGKDSRSTEVE